MNQSSKNLFFTAQELHNSQKCRHPETFLTKNPESFSENPGSTDLLLFDDPLLTEWTISQQPITTVTETNDLQTQTTSRNAQNPLLTIPFVPPLGNNNGKTL
jgi:hypothetical protein